MRLLLLAGMITFLAVTFVLLLPVMEHLLFVIVGGRIGVKQDISIFLTTTRL